MGVLAVRNRVRAVIAIEAMADVIAVRDNETLGGWLGGEPPECLEEEEPEPRAGAWRM